MRWKVLITAPRMLRDMPRLRPDIDALGWELVLPDVRQQLDEQQLLEVVGDIDAAICGDDAYTARVMDAAPKLKAICKWGTGIDEIDVEAARERGIHVRNVPDAFSVPVADTVLAFMLSFARRLPWLDRGLKQGGWEYIDGVSLAACTLGAVGCGNAGRTALRRARGGGLRGLCHGPVPRRPGGAELRGGPGGEPGRACRRRPRRRRPSGRPWPDRPRRGRGQGLPSPPRHRFARSGRPRPSATPGCR